MNETKLVRGINRWDLTAIAINSIIGAGIFGLPSKVAALIGGYSLLAFAVCALIVALIVLCFAEVSSRFARTGGSYLYAHEAFGSIVGFEVGWLFWLVRVTAFATNCNLLVGYLGYFFPGVNDGLPRLAVIAIVVLILAFVNFRGIREAATFTNFFTIGKLVPIILFVAIGVFFVQSGNFNFSTVPETGVFANAVLLLIYAFTGFEMAVVPAGEMREPQKNAPFALLTAIGIVAALFILIQLVCVGTLPELANSERPLADAANTFLGATGAAIIAAGAIISIFGNLNSVLLAASRVPFAMAEQNNLPSVFARVHEKFKTPHVSIFLTAAAMFALTAGSTFIYALTLSTITRLIVYATTCAALPVFRFRKTAPEAKFLAPFGTAAAIASLIFIVWLLANVKFIEFRDVAIAAAVGLLLCFLYRATGKSNSR